MVDLLPLTVAGAAFLVVMASRAPIGLAMLVGGTAGIVVDSGWSVASAVLGNVGQNATAKYALVVIPMYVLMGCLIGNSGVGEQIYRTVNAGVRALRVPGGLPATAVLATAFFSGLSGSSSADIAAFGKVSVAEMERNGYGRAYSAAVVAAAGTFAVLIPPSIGLVVYAIVAEVSVGAMVMAGVVPGVLSALVLTTYVIGRESVASRRKIGEPAEATAGGALPTETERSIWADLPGVASGLLIFAVVVGGLYGGVFTATEAGAVGALVALLVALLARPGRSSRRWQSVAFSFREAVGATGMIFLLLIGASVLTFLIASTGLPRAVTSWTVEAGLAPHLVVALLLVMLLALGTVIDGLSMLVLVVPLAAPVVVSYGLDPIWFGVLCLKAIEIGLITPPVGLNVFVISGMTRQRPGEVFGRIWTFVVLDIALTCVLFAFPEVTLWLPRQAGLL